MTDSLCKEMEIQHNYLKSQAVTTIYLGGGTPSLLSEKEIDALFNSLAKNFSISPSAEITLEANPDDLDKDTLKSFTKNGINRLSIGVQSFNDDHLLFLNRLHSAKRARESIITAQDSGIENISIDLIYGIPSEDHTTWENDLSVVSELSIQHISAYCLTIESRTVFGNRVKKGLMKDIDDAHAASQLELLMDILPGYGFEQYEISNFAKGEYVSKHNSSYWLGEHYLGIGPGAHSFNGESRKFNISNNIKYMNGLKNGLIPFEEEILSPRDKINEYLLTGLRTKWGLDYEKLKDIAQKNSLSLNKQFTQIEINIQRGLLLEESGKIKLSHRGKFLADKITSDLFLV
jgi:oxygen-independent coproporphyrinogen III oxidase